MCRPCNGHDGNGKEGSGDDGVIKVLAFNKYFYEEKSFELGYDELKSGLILLQHEL